MVTLSNPEWAAQLNVRWIGISKDTYFPLQAQRKLLVVCGWAVGFELPEALAKRRWDSSGYAKLDHHERSSAHSGGALLETSSMGLDADSVEKPACGVP